jgi:peroxiredoxin
VLGICRVEIKEVDQLLIGGAIEEAAAQLAYQQWKLQHAVEPRFASAAASGAATAGTESALVGKPAPDFELELLGGGKFRLSEHQGNIVVLDFWATWCGPCLQAMPQIDRAVRDVQEQNVQLVAVNLLESPEQIASTLERLNLQIPVGLDQDGIVAEKYAASAIPQTVVIDRDGKVARVFVGGGPQYGEQLSEALKLVVNGDVER